MNVNLISDMVEGNFHLPNRFSPTICKYHNQIHPSIHRILAHIIVYSTIVTCNPSQTKRNLSHLDYLYLSKKLNNFGFHHRAAESTFEMSLYFLSRAKTKKTNIKTTVHFKLQNKQYLNVTNRVK